MFSIPPAPAIVLRAGSWVRSPGAGVDLKAKDVDANELRRAVIYGSVMGSFCCERFGVDRFRTLTRQEIDARFEEFKEFTSF